MYRPHTSQNDYEVNNPPLCQKMHFLSGLGWKTIDTMSRVGKEDRPTEGIQEDYEMVIAPKTKRDPHLEVAGGRRFIRQPLLRPLRLRVSDRGSHTGFVDEGLGGIVDGPTLAAFRG